MDSVRLARSLQTNPVVVRRLLKCMEREGLVELRPGKNGGVRLQRSPHEITLDAIYKAVEGDGGVLALRAGVNRNCPVSCRMKDLLSPVFDSAADAVSAALRQTTIGSLVEAID